MKCIPQFDRREYVPPAPAAHAMCAARKTHEEVGRVSEASCGGSGGAPATGLRFGERAVRGCLGNHLSGETRHLVRDIASLFGTV
mmetsp:Transcript_55481/g.166372  ORF Transcript_55481/g.166372 Transcript_55481/m.166372 type:complete len:85 (+) Transcript_55481:551-805(+)